MKLKRVSRVGWAFLKMVLPLYLNLLHVTLRDVNALNARAEDPRLKKFRKWFEGENPAPACEELNYKWE